MEIKKKKKSREEKTKLDDDPFENLMFLEVFHHFCFDVLSGKWQIQRNRSIEKLTERFPAFLHVVDKQLVARCCRFHIAVVHSVAFSALLLMQQPLREQAAEHAVGFEHGLVNCSAVRVQTSARGREKQRRQILRVPNSAHLTC